MRNRTVLIALLAGILLILAPATVFAGGVYAYGGTFNLPIPANPDDTNGWMNDAIIEISEHLTIRDLDVNITVQHAKVFDLQIYLQSPSGTTLCLNSYDIDEYFEGENYTQTIFDDEAAIAIEQGTPPFTSRFKPKAGNLLEVFDGQDAHGLWQLKIYDAYEEGTGTLSSFELTISTVFSGTGSGIEQDPYIITDIYQLQEMNDHLNDPNVYFELGSDIDASDTKNWNDGAGFTPIGNGNDPNYFTGHFDGKGHTIILLYINNRPSSRHNGLFEWLGAGASVSDVGLADVNITGSLGAGGLVFFNQGTISNSYCTGTVSGGGNGIGGLVGYNYGMITESYFTGNVTGGSYVGGLVGCHSCGVIGRCYSEGSVINGSAGGLVGVQETGTHIEDSYSTASVSGNSYVAGGFLGICRGNVNNCYSTGNVSGADHRGGFIGVVQDGASCTNCYWDIETSEQTTSARGTPKTTAEMKRQATFSGWDFENIWDILENETYPFLRGNNWLSAYNSIADAYNLGVLSGTESAHGFVDETDPQDYYSFILVGSVSDFTVTIEGLGGRHVTLQLIEDKNNNGVVDDGETLGSITPSFSGSVNRWLEPGTYYILVDYHSSSVEYDLTLTETPKPDSLGIGDNSLNNARYLGTLTGNLNLHDFVGNTDIEDYYSFILVGSVSDFTVTIEGLGGRYVTLQLIEDKNANGVVDDGEVLGSIEPSFSGSISRWIEPGTYYIWVNYHNSSVEYDLSLTTVQELLGPSGAPPADEYFLGNQEKTSGSSADPVSTATGDFFHSETDFLIAARGKTLEFNRYYNSQDSSFGPLGFGWRHSYYIYLIDDLNLASVHWADGHTDFWNPDGQGGYEPNTPGLYDSLAKNGGEWTVTKKNLDKYVFDLNGQLTTISDKNGNTINLSYGNPSYPGLVTSVSGPAGRTVTLVYNASGLLTSVTDFASLPRVVNYSYTSGRLTQVTDVLGNTIDYIYNADDYLETITDQRGVTTVINNYDSQGRVTEQWDGNSNKTVFSYDTPEPNQTTITDPNGNTTVHTHFSGYKLLRSIENPLGDTITYYYDENMNRTAIVDRNHYATHFSYNSRANVIEKVDSNNPADPCDGGITIVEYNDSNFPDLPTKKIDALGNVWTYEFDANGNLIQQVDPNGNAKTWTYNSFGQKLTETDENGHAANYIYNADGLLMEVVDPNANHTWYGYDELWRRTSLTDGRGSYASNPDHTTTIEYDNADKVISVIGPITSRSYQYDKVGNRTHATNGRGYTTVYEYDNNNNLTKIERIVPAGPNQVSQYAYDELDRKISKTNPNGNVTTYEYDNAGRLTKTTDPEGNETTYTYDAQGNIRSGTDGSGVTTHYKYDPLNRKIHQYDELGNHWYQQYDKLGNIIKRTDAAGNVTQYEYDSLNRLISVTDAVNDATEYEYDAVGNLTKVKDASGKVIKRKFYDSANRLIRKEDGSGNSYEYTYDGAGNIITEVTPNGNIKTYVYDNENRLNEIHYPNSSQVSYSYDDNGNLTSMTDSTGTTTYTYDELDKLTSSTDSFGKTVQYDYDIIGNRTSITYPADSTNPARTVNYTFDKANRLDTITDWAARTWDYTMDGAGRIVELNYPSGVRKVQSYDGAGRLSSLIHKNSSDANLITYSYSRDEEGNPIEIQETGTLDPVLDLPLKEDYIYDNDNRLTETTKPATYGYDNNGNMMSRVTGGVATTFTYDFENRLTSQTTDGNTIEHVYDGQGSRIARIENGMETRYILDRGRDMSHVLCETDSSGEIIAYYIHGSQIIGRIAADNSVRYYHTNHIGSVVALTDETETITDRYAYTPFGVPSGRQGSTPNPFTYIGGLGVMAEANGLYFMRARFYDPEAGRFLQTDPVEGTLKNPQSLHWYLYCLNNPIMRIDPKGLCGDKSNQWLLFYPEMVQKTSERISGYFEEFKQQSLEEMSETVPYVGPATKWFWEGVGFGTLNIPTKMGEFFGNALMTDISYTENAEEDFVNYGNNAYKNVYQVLGLPPLWGARDWTYDKVVAPVAKTYLKVYYKTGKFFEENVWDKIF